MQQTIPPIPVPVLRRVAGAGVVEAVPLRVLPQMMYMRLHGLLSPSLFTLPEIPITKSSSAQMGM
jgi:hypothetical protein